MKDEFRLKLIHIESEQPIPEILYFDSALEAFAYCVENVNPGVYYADIRQWDEELQDYVEC